MAPEASQRKMPAWEQGTLYVCLVIGVLVSSALRQFVGGQTPNLSFTLVTFVLALVVALVIAPLAYERLGVSPGSPLLVRVGLFVQQGVFWDVLFGSLGKVAQSAG